MTNITYNKLVRDRIPEIIEASGKTCRIEYLSKEKYIEMLDTKLSKELREYQADKSMEELADLLEVVRAVAAARGSSIEEVEEILLYDQMKIVAISILPETYVQRFKKDISCDFYLRPLDTYTLRNCNFLATFFFYSCLVKVGQVFISLGHFKKFDYILYRWGSRGRRFKFSHPDHKETVENTRFSTVFSIYNPKFRLMQLFCNFFSKILFPDSYCNFFCLHISTAPGMINRKFVLIFLCNSIFLPPPLDNQFRTHYDTYI